MLLLSRWDATFLDVAFQKDWRTAEKVMTLQVMVWFIGVKACQTYKSTLNELNFQTFFRLVQLSSMIFGPPNIGRIWSSDLASMRIGFVLSQGWTKEQTAGVEVIPQLFGHHKSIFSNCFNKITFSTFACYKKNFAKHKKLLLFQHGGFVKSKLHGRELGMEGLQNAHLKDVIWHQCILRRLRIHASDVVREHFHKLWRLAVVSDGFVCKEFNSIVICNTGHEMITSGKILIKKTHSSCKHRWGTTISTDSTLLENQT